MRYLLTVFILVNCTVAFAQEHESTPGAEHGSPSAQTAEDLTHPTTSSDSTWAFPVVVVILAMFLAAMVIGPISRALGNEELPPAHSHDEPPGTSGHHGATGTVNPDDPHPGH